MNMFEREGMEHDDSLQWSGILSAWGTFTLEVLQLIDSYKKFNSVGKLYGANIQKDDHNIVLVCDRGPCPAKPFSALVIRVQAKIVPERPFSITCNIEECCKPPAGSVSVEREESMIFDLANDHTSLVLGKENLTPAEAASKLLEILLSRK